VLAIRAPETRTGVRINFTEDTFQNSFGSPVYDKASNLLDPARFNDADGFSPLGLILIPLPEALDPASLPDIEDSVSADSPIYLLNMSSGARIPIDVRLDEKGLEQTPSQYILAVTTRDRVDFEGSFLMVLTRGLWKPDGTPLNPFPNFQTMMTGDIRSDPLLSRLEALYRPLLDYMEQQLDINLNDVLLAFDFTVRSEESLTRIPGSLCTALFEGAVENPPSFHPDELGMAFPYSNAAVRVSGWFPSPNFRKDDRTLRLGPDGLPQTEEDAQIDLLLLVPRKAAQRPAPVVIFGHGFMASKETMIQCSQSLTEAGFAVLGIDMAAHGARSERDGFIGDYLTVEKSFQMRDALIQTVADEIQLCRLIQSDLSLLDVMPFWTRRRYGDGTPDLDTNRVYFVSQSLGSMIGTILLAYEPSMDAAVLNVPGGGLINIFRNAESEMVQDFASGFLPEEDFASGFLPEEATPLERLQLMALQQMPFDLIDPLNYAHRVVRFPRQGCEKKQVLLQQAIGDGLVPHQGTASLARSLGIPLVEPFLQDIPDLAHVSAPADSAGLFQFFVHPDPLAAHGLLLTQAQAHRQIVEFYRSYLEEGVARIIDPG
jgi:pimeloyl-ACP methyl ester carboxylesterase